MAPSLSDRASRFRSSLSLDTFMQEHYLPRAREYKRSWKIDVGIYRRHIQARLGATALNKLTPRDLQNLQADLEAQGFKETSILRILALLKAALKEAVRQGLLSNILATNLKTYQKPQPRICQISAEELEQIQQALWKSPDPNARAILLLMNLGSHMSETLALRWEDVDLERSTVSLTGFGRKKVLPLSDEAIKIIQAIPRGESPWLFPGKGEGHMKCIFHTWRKTREALNLPHIQLRDLEMLLRRFLTSHGHNRRSVMKMLELSMGNA